MKKIEGTQQKRLQLAAWLLWAAAIIGFSLVLACERTVTCNYVSINGDFQSYNVFRRMMVGQFPYRDFANYIGMAPVFCNYLGVLALGGSFRASLFVTTFTTNILFSIAVFLLLWLVSQKTYFSMLVSCVLSKFISTQIIYAVLGPTYGYLFTQQFSGLYTPSNSMRMARCFLPFALVGFLLIYRHFATRNGRSLCDILRAPAGCAVCGGILGLAIVWSNDYALACLACVTIILLLLHLTRYRTGFVGFLKAFAAYLGAFFAGALVITTLVTGGQPLSWLHAFIANGEYQYFYFNGTGSVPVLTYLLHCREFWLWSAPFLLYLVIVTVQIFRRRLTENTLLLYFVCSSILAGTLAYILSGSGFNFKEALVVFTLLFLGGWLMRGLTALVKRLKIARPTATKISGRLIGTTAVGLLAVYFVFCGGRALAGHTDATPEGSYIEALDGYNTSVKALVDAAELTEGEEVFSVYATGLEVVKGQYQPTGCDYIIHALGADTQAEYVRNFTAGEYRYAQTPSMSVDGWLTLENWYFYRELYRNYRKVFQTEYSWLWEYAGNQALPAEVTAQAVMREDGSVDINCSSSYTGECIADVQITYTTAFASPLARLLNLGRKAIRVQTGTIYTDSNSYTSFALSGDGTCFIPVVMQNGVGMVHLESLYSDGIVFKTCDTLFCDILPRHALTTAD